MLPAASLISDLSAVVVVVLPALSTKVIVFTPILVALLSLSLIVIVSPAIVVDLPSLPFTPIVPWPSLAVIEIPFLPSLPLIPNAPLPSLPTVADTTSLPSAFFTIIAPSLGGITSAGGTAFAFSLGVTVVVPSGFVTTVTSPSL